MKVVYQFRVERRIVSGVGLLGWWYLNKVFKDEEDIDQ